MRVFFDDPTPQERADYAHDLALAATHLRTLVSRTAEDPQFEGMTLSAWVLAELHEALGADVQSKLLMLIFRQIIEHAPPETRNDANVPVLDRIVRHVYTHDEVTENVTAYAQRASIGLPNTADLKGYTTRSVTTGARAQHLLELVDAPPEAPMAGLVYSMTLMDLYRDPVQLNDVLFYLLTVSTRLSWTAGPRQPRATALAETYASVFSPTKHRLAFGE
jgi:hypothetical protein